MQKFKFVLFLLFSALTSQATIAGELRLDYSSFYSHLKKIDDDELQSLRFAFGFLNVQTKDLCTPESVLVHTNKKDITIEVNEHKRFELPTEKALKLAKAEVHIQLTEPNNRCDLSVLLEVKPSLFVDGVSATELQGYFTAFVEFFDKMGSFLSFLMPSPEGMHLKFKAKSEEPAAHSDTLIPEDTANTYTLMEEGIAHLPADVKLQDIIAVTAFVPK